MPTGENPDVMLPWDTFGIAGNRHNVRVLCDLAGLSLTPTVPVVMANEATKMFTPKDVICACIEQESNFQSHYLAPDKRAGQPVIHQNFAYDATGTRYLASTDFGICQINDYYHIGPGKDFASVGVVLNDPAGCVNFMIAMFKGGHLSMWDSFKNGGFKQYLPGA